MKTTIKILTMCFLIIIFSCEKRKSNEKTVSILKDSFQTKSTAKKQKTQEENKNKIAEQNKIDSLRLNKVLNEALQIGKQNIKSNKYFKEYEQTIDSSFNVKTNLTIGHFFSKTNKHLIIRRTAPWAVYLDVYLIKDNNFKSVICREQGQMTYIDDSIMDVNGDGLKDFLVHWYPSSGCCRRDVYNVYLNQSDKGAFSNDYEFINPTFSPKEKIIRGIEYGHPGQVGLYKYRWNGSKIDTLEFIYPNVNKVGQFIKTKKGTYRPTEKEGMVLKSVPKEYKNIKSYEWFTDF